MSLEMTVIPRRNWKQWSWICFFFFWRRGGGWGWVGGRWTRCIIVFAKMVNFCLESLKYFIVVFTWRHNGHIGVQNNETAAILVYQDNPVELFSLHLKNCLLFREINIATDHVSEDDLFLCSPPEKPRDTMPKSHCHGQTGRVMWVRFSTSIRKHDVAYFI